MAEFFTILTDIGLAKVTNAIALGQTVSLTEMAVGDGNGNPTTPTQDQTGLLREQYRTSINLLNVDDQNPNYIISEMVIPVDVGGWTVHEVGVFDDQGDMIAVANFPATYKPVLAEGSSRDLVVRIIIEVANAEAVELKTDPAIILASRSWVIDNFMQADGGTTGQLLRKTSNADREVEWFTPDIESLNIAVDAVVEQQTLAVDQTVVQTAQVSTVGMALYIEGAREFDFTVDGPTQFTLGQSYPDGTRIWMIQNDPNSNLSRDFITPLADISALSSINSGDLVDGQKFRIYTTDFEWSASLQAFVVLNSLDVRCFGAKGDGSTDDLAAIQQALDYGAKSVYAPSGNYLVSDTLSVPAGVEIFGDGEDLTKITATGVHTALQAQGSLGGTAYALSADAGLGLTSIALGAGDGNSFDDGDWIILYRTATYTDITESENTQKVGQIVRINDVSGDTLTLDSVIRYDFPMSDASAVRKLNLADQVKLKGLTVQSADGNVNTAGLVSFLFCYKPTVSGVTAQNSYGAGIKLFGCVGASVKKYRAIDLASSDSIPYFGYGIEEAGANVGGRFEVYAERVRHAYTTNRSDSTMPYGEPVGSIVRGTSKDSRAAAWDTHGPGDGVIFDSCTVDGSLIHGFQIRSRNTIVNGGTVRGAIGAGAYVVGLNSYKAVGTQISGLTCEHTNLGTDINGQDWTDRGAIYDNGIRTKVSDIGTNETGGPGVQADGSFYDDGEYTDITVRNPNRLGATNKYGVGTDLNLAVPIKVKDVKVTCIDSKMDYGVYAPSTNLDGIFKGIRVTGAQISPVFVNSSHYSSDNPAQGYVNSMGPGLVLSISAGEIAVPSSARGQGVLQVSGEGDLADDLETISFDSTVGDGALITLRRGTGTITVKHGVGNIALPGGTDVVLNSALTSLTLRHQDGTWVEFCRAI